MERLENSRLWFESNCFVCAPEIDWEGSDPRPGSRTARRHQVPSDIPV